MPLLKPKFTPGVDKDDTALAAEGGWVDADKVRFYRGTVQVIGGWQMVPATLDPASTVVFDVGTFDGGVFREGASLGEAMYSGQARGAHEWNDLTGTPNLAWGTDQGLYVMVNSIIYDITPTTFVPATGTSSAYGSGNYGSGVFGGQKKIVWALDNWGQNLLANPTGGTLYEWTPGTPKALPVANAPAIIDYMFVSPERIVVLLGTAEFGGAAYNPMLVRWSDQGNNTTWTPAPSNLAGEFPLSNGGKLMSGLVARGQNLLWSDIACYTMQFTGDVSSVFGIRCVGDGCGLISRKAAVASNSAVYWMSRDNFYVFTGQVPQILPCSMRRDVFDNIYSGKEDISHAGWNTGYGEPWFFYADIRDATGEISRYAGMSPDGNWFPGTFDRTAWVRAGVYPYPIAFSANRNIYNHEIPNAGNDGTAMDAFIESGFIDIGDGDTLYIVKRFVPDFKNQGPTVNLTLKTRKWANGPITVKGPYAAAPTAQKVDLRVKARQMAIRLESNAIPPAAWGLGAIEFDTQQTNEKW